MRPALLLALALVAAALTGVCAQPDISADWEVTWGNTGAEDYFYSTVSGDGSGSIYVVGNTNGPLGTPSTPFTTGNLGAVDSYVLKYNNRGAQQWMRVFQTSSDDIATAVATDAQGNVYVGGGSGGYLQTLVPSQPGYRHDSFMAKYDSNGIQLWFAPFIMSTEHDYVQKIVVKDTFLYVLGTVRSSANNLYRSYVKKLQQSDGAELWSTTFFNANGHDWSGSLHVDANNYIYVVGETSSNVANFLDSDGNTVSGFSYMGGGRDGFLVILDSSNGNRLLNIPIATAGDDFAAGVTTDGLGGIYVAGATTQPMHGESYSGTGSNCFLVKYQVTGAVNTLVRSWTRMFGGDYSSCGRTLQYDGVGGLFLIDTYAGYASGSDVSTQYGSSPSQYNRALRKFDTNGNLIWSYTFPGNVASATLSSNGVLVTTGIFSGNLGAQLTRGTYDGFIRQQVVNYNCSCSDLASLVNEVQGLLNIAPVF